jgi:hypothetical protein
MLLEAVLAVHRAPLSRLERHFAVLATVRALCRMHLSGATEAPSPPVPSVSILHILTLCLSTSPSRTVFASAAPFRERHFPNHLPRWSVYWYIMFQLSKYNIYYLLNEYCFMLITSQFSNASFSPILSISSIRSGGMQTFCRLVPVRSPKSLLSGQDDIPASVKKVISDAKDKKGGEHRPEPADD